MISVEDLIVLRLALHARGVAVQEAFVSHGTADISKEKNIKWNHNYILNNNIWIKKRKKNWLISYHKRPTDNR